MKSISVNDTELALIREALPMLEDMENDLRFERIESVDFYQQNAVDEVMTAPQKQRLKEEIQEAVDRAVALNTLKMKVAALS